MNEQAVCRYCKAVCYKDNAIVMKVGKRSQTIYICDDCFKKLLKPVKTT